MRRLVLLCALVTSSVASAEEVPRTQRVLELGMHEGVLWPIINAPVDGPLPGAPQPTEPAPAAPTKAGGRVLAMIEQVRSTAVESKYQHATSVRAKDGVYNWDCSGMAAWILRRTAPVALQSLGSDRPVARDFVAAIERAKPRGAWQRVDRIADVMPGDVFAWRRPRGLPSKNTGHVGFVLDRPVPVPEIPNAWAVRIVDSTSGSHQDDTRAGDTDGGFGIGTLTFLVDSNGRATSYGWAGTHSEWYIVTPVVFGRVTR